jgi:hypothetical protein
LPAVTFWPRFRSLFWALACLGASSCAAEHVVGSLGFLVEAQGAGLPAVSAPQVAVGDFDHDGHDDVAVLDGAAGRLCWLAGAGDGTLAAASCQSLAALIGTELVAAARFVQPSSANDADGPMDLVAAGAQLALLSAGADGRFTIIDQAPSAGGAAALLLADASFDERFDVLVADKTSPTVSMWPLRDDHRLGPRLRYELPEPPRAIALHDLDSDGTLELAAVGPSGVVVHGERLTQIEQCPPGPSGLLFDDATGLAVLDAEGDGGADLLVADVGRGGLVLLRQSERLRFACGEGLPWQKLGRVVALLRGDFDGDGGADVLAVSTGEALLLSRGALFDKSGKPAPRYLLPGLARAAALGDLDGNGRPDAVVALEGGALVLLRNVFIP